MPTARPEHPDRPLLLLTGASGYVGGRLLKVLEEQGRRLRCLCRRPEFLKSRTVPTTEVLAGDVLDPASLRQALAGVHTAYYLVHSLASDWRFEEQEYEAARNFAEAAREAGVRRIIYLGGLGRGPALSPHLRSRQEVGRLLRESGVLTIEFRASIIIGSGSLSFELIRALVEKLPVMITPRWTRSRAQPIAIEDVVQYLVAAADLECSRSEVFEIGGRDVVSYSELMQEYARQRKLRRWVIEAPVLTPRLSSLWLGLVTPVYARVGRKLIDGVRHDTVVSDPAALSRFALRPRGMQEAIARALSNEDHEFATTRWSDALSSRGPTKSRGGGTFGTRIVDSRAIRVAATPEAAFGPIERIGGRTGWYYAGFLWRVRGWIDLLVGGVGLRRGRRDPHRLAPGDAVDFWRVEACERPRLLRLAAEMRLPGRAWLQFEVDPDGPHCIIRQTAVFDPRGLGGLVYWYGLYPLHAVIFKGLLRRLASAATAASSARSS